MIRIASIKHYSKINSLSVSDSIKRDVSNEEQQKSTRIKKFELTKQQWTVVVKSRFVFFCFVMSIR